MIWEANKFQDLQSESVSQRLKRAPISAELEGGKSPCSSLRATRKADSIFTKGKVSPFVLLDETHPHSDGQCALLSPPIQMLIFSKNILSDIPRIVFDQLVGYPMAQSRWHKKLIIKLPLFHNSYTTECDFYDIFQICWEYIFGQFMTFHVGLKITCIL